MTPLRRIYLLADTAGHFAVVIAPDEFAARQAVWHGDWDGSGPVEVHMLGVARDGVPGGMVGRLDGGGMTPGFLVRLRAVEGQA